ncbi:hypothetical protein PHJA_001387500 [Phtheirospermum japonicum]|uniref:Transmembrane protein n=1 Tax=Phtheirospermum japonicum TaxID=374723 RepID=A0A830C8S1_9LAMI|nr:hypothetical protein PHJA_001387500 [Phtheirospermum japonicum]
MSDPQADDGQKERSLASAGWVDKIAEQYRKTKEHAETYPYVWGSYILVYGGFGLWLTYRWRKLRATEDRVRVLQEKLRKKAEGLANSAAATEQSANAASSANKPPLVADKAAKKLGFSSVKD